MGVKAAEAAKEGVKKAKEKAKGVTQQVQAMMGEKQQKGNEQNEASMNGLSDVEAKTSEAELAAFLKMHGTYGEMIISMLGYDKIATLLAQPKENPKEFCKPFGRLASIWGKRDSEVEKVVQDTLTSQGAVVMKQIDMWKGSSSKWSDAENNEQSVKSDSAVQREQSKQKEKDDKASTKEAEEN